MTTTKITKAEQCSRDYIAAHRELERRVKLLTASKTFRDRKSVDKHYGHTGTILYINTLLAQVLHHAGVEEFVEK
jgi:hypothetical protein